MSKIRLTCEETYVLSRGGYAQEIRHRWPRLRKICTVCGIIVVFPIAVVEVIIRAARNQPDVSFTNWIIHTVPPWRWIVHHQFVVNKDRVVETLDEQVRKEFGLGEPRARDAWRHSEKRRGRDGTVK